MSRLSLIAVVAGVYIGIFVYRPNFLPLRAPSGLETRCPTNLPVDPLQRNPLLPNDTRVQQAGKELAKRLQGVLNGADGAVVIVVHGGQTLLEWTYGRIRSNESVADDNRKVTADTIWRIASITKVFVDLEGLIQQNRGSLSLDDDVRDYLDNFKLYQDAPHKITLRALGSHLSGMGRDGTVRTLQI